LVPIFKNCFILKQTGTTGPIFLSFKVGTSLHKDYKACGKSCLERKIEIIGGLILIGIGMKILIDHLT